MSAPTTFAAPGRGAGRALAIDRPAGPQSAALGSFAEIFRQEHAFVWRSLKGLGVHDGALDDATQDVFLVVHRRLADFEGRSTLRTWLYGIARRVAYRHRQRRQLERTRMSEFRAHEATKSRDSRTDPYVHQRAREACHAFTDGLAPALRDVFVLSECLGMTAREIGATLELNPNTVTSRLRRARASWDAALVRLQARESREVSELARRIAANEAANTPGPAHRQRAWALLLPYVGQGSSVAAPGGIASLGLRLVQWSKAGACTVAVAGATLSGVAAVDASLRGEGSAQTPQEQTARKQSTRRPDRSSAPTSSVQSLTSPASPQPIPHTSLPVPETPPAITAPEPPPHRARRTSTVRSAKQTPENLAVAPQPEGQGPADDDLGPIIAGLLRAKAASRAGQHGKALVLLNNLANTYPANALAPEIAAQKIGALCGLGREAELARAQKAFVARFPKSTLLPSILATCAPAGR